MLTPNEATEIILQHLFIPKQEMVSLQNACGRVLMQLFRCTADLPPFDRVMMDGYAMRYADIEAGTEQFAISAMQRAGEPAIRLTANAHCIEIMTGSVCPVGADVVVPYEDVRVANNTCSILKKPHKQWQNIHKQRADKRMGDELMKPGILLTTLHIAALASQGLLQVMVATHPRVHVLSTGDELVDVGATPLPYQIRRSNVILLQQMLKQVGIAATESHIPDDEELIRKELEARLKENDVLILSGGVSKGKFDLIPKVLQALGVKEHFHRIAQKPGKPMWFGTLGHVTVFALPGNPVSTHLCAVRYLLPWLRASMLQSATPIFVEFAGNPVGSKGLTKFIAVYMAPEPDGVLRATPIVGNGSGDYASLLGANAFMQLPHDTQYVYREEEGIQVYAVYPF
ncbi:MAG: molybdopterin molybdotransferase MoeA [Flavobacteriales bacterium]